MIGPLLLSKSPVFLSLLNLSTIFLLVPCVSFPELKPSTTLTPLFTPMAPNPVPKSLATLCRPLGIGPGDLVPEMYYSKVQHCFFQVSSGGADMQKRYRKAHPEMPRAWCQIWTPGEGGKRLSDRKRSSYDLNEFDVF
jgi:hypothetical protein